MHKIIAALTGSLTFLAVSSAWAQDEFAKQGTLALSADRLLGFTLTKEHIESDPSGTTIKTTNTAISLLGRGTNSPYGAPRLGIDYFVIDGLSLGGSLIFASGSADTKTESAAGSVSSDGPSTTAFVLAPRVGYGIMFDDVFGIWPRGGFTYYTSSSKTESQPFGSSVTQEVSSHGFALTLEVPLLISPARHIAFTVGPTFDIPLSGRRKTETTTTPPTPAREITMTAEEDDTFFEFGVLAGLLVWL